MSHADSYIGKYVLLGLNYIDTSNTVVDRRQLHGYIVRASDEAGVVVRLEGGEEVVLPPVFEALHPAEPGEYYLKDTEEVVIDPDFTAVWTFPAEDRA